MKTLNVLVHVLWILSTVLVCVGMVHQSDFTLATGFLCGGSALFSYLVYVLRSDAFPDADSVDTSVRGVL